MRSSNERCALQPRAIISMSGVFVIFDLDFKDWITFFVEANDETMIFRPAIHTPFSDSWKAYSGIYRSIIPFPRSPPSPPFIVKLRWIHLVYLLSPFVSNRRKRVMRNGGRLSYRISDRRAYMLPAAAALWRKRRRPRFQTRGEFLSGATSMESARSIKSFVGRLDSKIVGGVMGMILQNQDIRNMQTHLWVCEPPWLRFFFSLKETPLRLFCHCVLMGKEFRLERLSRVIEGHPWSESVALLYRHSEGGIIEMSDLWAKRTKF